MADTAYDRAHAWLIAQLHQVWCGGTEPPRGDRIGQSVHANHDYDARDILDGCEVREEWGVRLANNTEHHFAAGINYTGEQVARGWFDYLTAAGRGATLIRRYVITTPPTEDTDHA